MNSPFVFSAGVADAIASHRPVVALDAEGVRRIAEEQIATEWAALNA